MEQIKIFPNQANNIEIDIQIISGLIKNVQKQPNGRKISKFCFFKKILEYGAKWVKISEQLSGRSENHLKNKFYGIIRKVSRRIQKYQKSLKPKPKKLINDRFIIKAIEEFRRTRNNNDRQITGLQSMGRTKKEIEKQLTNMMVYITEESPEDEIELIVNFFRKVMSPSLRVDSQHQYKNINKVEIQLIFNDKISEQESFSQNQKSVTGITIQGNSWSQNLDKMEMKMKFIDVEVENSIHKYNTKNLQQQLCNILDCEYIPTSFSLIW